MTAFEIIINSDSGVLAEGGGEKVLDDIRRAFADEQVDADLKVCSGDAIAENIRLAVESDRDIIVVGGGDGTVNTAASAVADAGKVLGILPMGSLNLYARDLKMPLDLTEAVHSLVHGEIRPVDYAEVQGRLYLCNSVIGILPPLVRHRERLRGESIFRRIWGVIRISFRLLKRNPRFHVDLVLNGERHHMKLRGLAVCNNAYHDAYALFPSPVPLDAGRLMVYAAKGPTRLGTLLLTLRLFLGTWNQERDLVSFPTDKVTLSTRRKLVSTVTDGEIIEFRQPLTFRIHPRGLRVIMPAETAMKLDEKSDSEGKKIET